MTTWLHRIVVNACLDRVRRRASRPADPLPDHDLPARGPDPLAARELALDLDAALATLPAEQRAALLLVDMYGYPVDDVARDPRLPRRHREEPMRAGPGAAAAVAAARSDTRRRDREPASTPRASHRSEPPSAHPLSHPPKEVTRTDELATDATDVPLVPRRPRHAGRPPRRPARAGAGRRRRGDTWTAAPSADAPRDGLDDVRVLLRDGAATADAAAPDDVVRRLDDALAAAATGRARRRRRRSPRCRRDAPGRPSRGGRASCRPPLCSCWSRRSAGSATAASAP